MLEELPVGGASMSIVREIAGGGCKREQYAGNCQKGAQVRAPQKQLSGLAMPFSKEAAISALTLWSMATFEQHGMVNWVDEELSSCQAGWKKAVRLAGWMDETLPGWLARRIESWPAGRMAERLNVSMH
eukprot:72832-Chlamydomonas_euryale.AAC.2